MKSFEGYLVCLAIIAAAVLWVVHIVRLLLLPFRLFGKKEDDEKGD